MPTGMQGDTLFLMSPCFFLSTVMQRDPVLSKRQGTQALVLHLSFTSCVTQQKSVHSSGPLKFLPVLISSGCQSEKPYLQCPFTWEVPSLSILFLDGGKDIYRSACPSSLPTSSQVSKCHQSRLMELPAPGLQAPHKERHGVFMEPRWYSAQVGYWGQLSVEIDIPVYGCKSEQGRLFFPVQLLLVG